MQRRKAASELGRLGDAGAVEPLCRALWDEDAHVRRGASVALGKLRDPEAFDALHAALGSRQRGLRHSAALSLAQIASAHPSLAGRAVNAIVQAAQESKPEHRLQYVTALTAAGLVGVSPLCVEYNTRRSPSAQWCIREALIGLEQRLHLDVRRHLLADATLTASQQLPILEMLLDTPPKSWFAARQSPDPRRYCELLVENAQERADVKRGAQGILDYLSLGRASQRYEPTDRTTLLRMASGEENGEEQGDTLLRGSQASDASDPRPSLLDRLRGWFGWPL